MAFNARRNDVEAFTAGVWRPIMGGQFRIARAGNPEYEKALEESGYRKMDDPQDRHHAFLWAMSKGIVKDWDQDPKSDTCIVDDQGEPIPYSVDNCVQVLDENPDLVAEALGEARNMSNYRRADVEDQAKKPAASSGGAQSGKEKAGA